jgi:hypothetical protein
MYNFLHLSLKCCLRLASLCGYPNDYWVDPGQASDVDLELERTQVREIIRAVASVDESQIKNKSGSMRLPDWTIHVLGLLLTHCNEAFTQAKVQGQLPPETAIHLFSSLAKPVCNLTLYWSVSEEMSRDHARVIELYLEAQSTVTRLVVDALNRGSYSAQLMASCRTALIGSASSCPAMAYLLHPSNGQSNLVQAVENLLLMSINLAALSIIHIPELLAHSDQRNEYSIRGSMRPPGGEDHVGVVMLSRLVSVNPQFTSIVALIAKPSMADLCNLYVHITVIERQRGYNVLHGQGVSRKSRRLVLQTLCTLASTYDMNDEFQTSLSNLMMTAVEVILRYSGCERYDSEVYYELCEASFDLSLFSPLQLMLLCNKNDERIQHCLRILLSAYKSGFETSRHHTSSAAALQQVCALWLLVVRLVQFVHVMSCHVMLFRD